MSDNPADSLRRELEAAIGDGRCANALATIKGATEDNSQLLFRVLRAESKAFVDYAWPLILAALEAARADERERLQRENQELRERLEAIRRDPTLALVTTAVTPFDQLSAMDRGPENLYREIVRLRSQLAAARRQAFTEAAAAVQRQRDDRRIRWSSTADRSADYGLGVALHTIFALRRGLGEETENA